MYSFAQRPDTIAIDEPLYGHYLKESGDEHPGRDQILNSMECNGQKVIDNVMFKTYDSPVLFMKQMTHHLLNLDLSFLQKTVNVLLIRNPYEMIISYAKVISHPTIEQLGIKNQFELFNLLKKTNALHAVVDSKYLLMNPKNVLNQLCDKMGIPFFEEMLSWQSGAKPEDGVWADYWYSNVHKSTSFKPYSHTTETIPAHLESLYEECKTYYETLSKESIK
ncbi:MAG: hypothetical protein HKO56_09230 [Bacteroidia bacterium]|nr:hypothetical protein [Bacteroidia bacterium]NNM16828.1 hypothetical protein [Bacteroidia bacterium]